MNTTKVISISHMLYRRNSTVTWLITYICKKEKIIFLVRFCTQ